MTLTIEVAPEEERALEAKAKLHGQTLDEYLRDLVKREALDKEVLNSEVKPRGTQPSIIAEFLKLTEKLMPAIEAGTLVPPGSIDPTAILDAVRDEREAEIDAALWGTVGPGPSTKPSSGALLPSITSR